MNATVESTTQNTAVGAPRHSFLRGVARRLRYLPQRLLHRFRRRRALHRIGKRALPRGVLFVCHGNICRSPYAENAFRQALPDPLKDRIQVASAGLIGPDRPSPPTAQAVAGGRGVDMSEHRSQLLSPEAVQTADLVVVMDVQQRAAMLRAFDVATDQLVVLGDLDPFPIDQRAIVDPIGQPAEVFEDVYARIDRCLDSLVEGLRSGTPTRAPR